VEGGVWGDGDGDGDVLERAMMRWWCGTPGTGRRGRRGCAGPVNSTAFWIFVGKLILVVYMDPASLLL